MFKYVRNVIKKIDLKKNVENGNLMSESKWPGQDRCRKGKNEISIQASKQSIGQSRPKHRCGECSYVFSFTDWFVINASHY